ncbi:MAG: hypothetical protein K8L99_04785 [Anaerolineae bacterium]|nr:hypothetical protein [Anaerolineae bacterium]
MLENLSPNTAVLLAVGCVLLCGVGIILVIGLQIIGGLLDIIGGIFNIVFGLFDFGPLPGCGCFLTVFICGGCGLATLLITQVMATCGTPDAVNLCLLFGR